MTMYERHERITRRVEFVLPEAAPYVELEKAIAAATHELADAGVELWDDTIRVSAYNEGTVVYFELPGGVA